MFKESVSLRVSGSFARTAKNAEAEFAYREIIVCAYARDDLRRRKRSAERHLFPAGAASIPCWSGIYSLRECFLSPIKPYPDQ